MSAANPEGEAARLLFPAVRWDDATGFRGGWAEVERAVEMGVGGLIIFGGEAGAVRDLTEEVQRIAPAPLLIASDLERGAGQQFRGATPLPPAAAIGSLGDVEATRRAAEITAREARALGIGWVFAPVADVDLEGRSPIVGTRAFGADGEVAARQVEAWVRGCADGGALSCAKHFPGHGRAAGDSHVERPRVDASREELELDLSPFRAAVAAGVDSVMAAHATYAALDPSGLPATRSGPILQGVLRRALRFDGIIVTDAINMAGFSGGVGEGEGAIGAVAAGCDALLYPRDLEGTASAVASAIREGRLEAGRVREAGERIARAARRMGGEAVGRWGREEDRAWALALARRTLVVARGMPRLPVGPVRLLTIDDDLGGPHPAPPREALRQGLRRSGVALTEDGPTVIAVYADVRAWKGHAGISPVGVEKVREALRANPQATVLLFAHPRFAAQIPEAADLLAAWGGEPLMQEAVAGWLVTGRAV